MQYFATGTTGTDFNISSATATHTFNLPTASATNRGALSSGDWTTFNNKVSTSRSILTSLPLSGGGDLSANRTLSIAQSNTTTDGYLSGTDWTTFNNKIGGSGTANYVTRFITASTIGNGIIQDNGTNSSIGVAPSTPYKFRVSTSTASQYAIYGEGLGQGFSGVAGISSGAGALQNTGVYGSATGSTSLNIGIQGEVDNVTSVNIGGQFSATSGSANYSLQLQDGTQASGRFLKSVTAAGRANWAAITVSDVSGAQPTITLTTTGTSGAATFVANTLNIPQYTSGLTYFTEAQSTTAPNATVYANSLTAVSAIANTDFAIVPKGTGGLLLSVPDNTATGGNKRGTNAIDLQMVRGANTQVASGTNAILIGNNCTSSGSSAVTIGRSSTNASIDSVSIGSLNTVSGGANQGSVAIGYNNTTSGNGGVTLGGSNTASFANSTAIGYNNTATTAQNTAIGYACNATGSAPCIAMGYSANSSGQTSVSIGRSTTASGSYSLATGYGSNTYSIIGRWAHSPTLTTTSGENQKSTFVLWLRTTGNTPTALSSDNGAAGASNQINLQNNNSIRFKGSIVARQSGSTNTAAWDIDGLIQRGANAASTTLLISNVTLVQNTPAWGTPTLAANTTLGGLTINVTGVAATNIMWVATIDTTEVIYA